MCFFWLEIEREQHLAHKAKAFPHFSKNKRFRLEGAQTKHVPFESLQIN